ncbi:Bug family tripartite tricarboxylate transporter substrate binding protein [Cupriavidus malaysiensis]|uniref:Bug family tripartite tricarboxylate transporter substrate binding protein n=1 Tax=Cupriavidus malaysiensis TaxID=367825 RepID=UPI000A44BCB8|nr:tripartite tricarboxylate transporter substrate binding protein [Cupriavidus malaysiensis]
MNIKSITLLGLVGALAAAPGFAQDQRFPSQPIQIVVGFTPGGSADTTARIVGDGISRELGQPVVIVNKPGAGTNIAAQFVAKAPADGYTLLFGGTSLVYSPGLLYPSMKANLAKDFTPVGGVVKVPLLLIVKQDSPVRDVKQLMAAARSKPGQVNYGSTGAGVSPQIATEMLNARAGVVMTHIPYKGTAPMLTAMLAGDIDVAFDVASSSGPMIQAGKLRGLAVSGAARLRMFPDIPTIAESGYPGFDVATWYGLVAPQGTPAAVAQKINAALQKVLANPEIGKTLADNGNEVMPGTPAAFQSFLNSEYRKWNDTVKALNIKLD